MLVCAAIGSVLHLTVQRPAKGTTFRFCDFVACQDLAPNGVGPALAAPTNLAVFVSLKRAANSADSLNFFIGGRETQGSVFPLLRAVGTVDSCSRGMRTVPSGPVNLAATVELDESPVAQGD